MAIYNCAYCKKDFKDRSISRPRIYCSLSCRAKAKIGPAAPRWAGGPKQKVCPTCGNNFSPGKRKTIYCSKSCSKMREKNPNWNGGERTLRGYKAVLVPEHPAAWGYGYVRQHRLVMEKRLGRYLRDDEVVHHINGDRKDNRPENLEVLDPVTHAKKHIDPNTGHFKIRKK